LSLLCREEGKLDLEGGDNASFLCIFDRATMSDSEIEEEEKGENNDAGFRCVLDNAATSESEMEWFPDNWTRDEDATGVLSTERGVVWFWVALGALDSHMGSFSTVESGRGSWSSRRCNMNKGQSENALERWRVMERYELLIGIYRP